MKLYAIRTTDTKEWVRFNGLPSKGYAGHFVDSVPSIYNEQSDDVIRFAETETGHPCEWVEVQVIEANHLPDAGKLMYVLDTIDSQREEAADNYVSVNDGNIRNHWDFRQGAKWAIDAIKLGVADHLPDAGNKVEPSGDSGELEQLEREAFRAGRKLYPASHITQGLYYSSYEDWKEDGQCTERKVNEEWQSTRDNSRGKQTRYD